jgi:hypothetical protein
MQIVTKTPLTYFVELLFGVFTVVHFVVSVHLHSDFSNAHLIQVKLSVQKASKKDHTSSPV